MKVAVLLLMVVSLTACDDAPQQQAAPPAPKPQAEVIARHADAMGAGVFRYRINVKAGGDNFILTCTEDENNIAKRDCNWGYNVKASSIDWDVRDCEWEVYDPITGKSENPKCVYIGLTVWEVTTSQPSSASAQPTNAKTQKDVPAQTVEKGQTPEQVQSALGKPDEIVNLGTKMIYVYKDLAKVTFLNGKVSDVQ